MIDFSSQQRIAGSLIEAGANITAATLEAYAGFTSQMIDVWSASAVAGRRTASTPSRSVSARRRNIASTGDAALWPAAFSPLSFLPGLWSAPSAPSGTMQGVLFDPRAMLAMLDGMMSAWRLAGPTPAAAALMTAGVSHRVAWPTAKAGAAALDAAHIAARSVERAFSSYRSDGGHAVAQIIMLPEPKAVAALMPSLAAMMLQPWLAAWAMAPVEAKGRH